MKTKSRGLIALLVITIAASIGIIGIHSSLRATGPYCFGNPGVTDAEANLQGDRLYVSYCGDDAVVELSTATMTELRRFSIVNPTFMSMSPDDMHLYVISYVWGGRLNRIELSSGDIEWIPLDTGQALALFVEPSGDRVWVSGAVWPVEGEGFISDDTWKHPDTGRIIEIDTSDFSIARVTVVNAAPISIWYSNYSDCLYVLHAIPHTFAALPDCPTYSPVAVYDAESMQKVTEFFASSGQFTDFPHLQMTNWDDDGRYLCIPCSYSLESMFSIRVIDTATNTIAYDLHVIDMGNSPMGFKFAHKEVASDTLWAIAYRWIHDDNLAGQGSTVVRINTATEDYEFFLVEGLIWDSGDFTISPDGNTLYIPEIRTGELFVWSPTPNNPPVCSVSATPLSYTGPAPAVISFNASGSYDPDEGDTLSFSWDFNGDSVFGDAYDSGTDSEPVKNFYEDYTGPVTVRVTDNHNASSECSVEITVDIT